MDGHVQDFRPADAQAQSVWTGAGLELQGWRDERLVWRFDNLETIDRVLVDDVPLSEQLWRVVPIEDLVQIAVEAGFFDGLPHVVEVSGTHRGKRAKLSARYVSVYSGQLEVARPGCLRGWIFDESCPERAVCLVAEFEEAAAIGVTAVIERPELGGLAAQAGFQIGWEPPGDPLRHETPARLGPVTLRVRDTGLLPFGLLALPGSAGGIACAPLYRRLGPARVAVIIPVVAGVDAVLPCLDALRASQDRIGHEIIVVDDAVPDARLQRLVVEHAHESGFTYSRNARAVGVAGCVNFGMAMRPDHDIVLLDAATEVPPGWLDRLYRAAASDPAIATVTPLSNDASIMSLPAIGAATSRPYGLAPDAIDALCRTANAGIVRDVPTAQGFCTYIRRDAISALGPFDAMRFGRGKGAEGEFSQRARLAGWRNVAAADLFVHQGGALPFADDPAAARAPLPGAHGPGTPRLGTPRLDTLRLDTPRLDTPRLDTPRLDTQGAGLPAGGDAALAAFRRADPLRDVRHRIQLALWRSCGPAVVIVTHALPGGTGRHVACLSRDLAQEGRLVLWLQVVGEGEDSVVRLRTPDGIPAARHPGVLSYPGPTGAEEAMADVFAMAPDFIHVHHLMDLPASVEALLRRTGIPYVVTLHDYFFGCPRVTLLDEGGTFCGAPPVEHCAPCLAAAALAETPPHPGLHPSLVPAARSGEAWRAKWAPFLAGACQIIVPSGAAAHYVGRMFPELRLTVRPHPTVAPAPVLPAQGERAVQGERAAGERPAERKPWRIAVIGSIGEHKGSARLHELVRHCHRREPDLRFVIVGSTDREEALARYANVEMAGEYAPENAVEAIAAARCAVALFLSVTPETYCFALSEALLAGLVPVAFDLGAIGERLRALGEGVLIATHSPPEAIVVALRQAAEMDGMPEDRARRTAIDSVYAELFGDYYAPLPPPAEATVAAMIGDAAGLFSDLWCTRRFALTVQSRLPLREIGLKLWCHPDHLAQNATLRIAGEAPATAWMVPGAVTAVALPVRDPAATLRRIAGAFDFATPLGQSDQRRGAAMLVGLWIVPDGGARLDYRFEGAGEEGSVELSLLPS